MFEIDIKYMASLHRNRPLQSLSTLEYTLTTLFVYTKIDTYLVCLHLYM